MLAVNDKFVSNLILFFIFIALLFLIRLLFWKSRKIHHVAEKYSTISLTDKYMIKSLHGVPGVWAQYVGNRCWNVCKTKNIGMEMSLDARRCIVALENTLKNNKKLIKEYPNQGSVAIRYRNLVKYSIRRRKRIRFVLIVKDIYHDGILEFEEMKFAIENKAIAWNPAPGKQTKAYWAWRNNKGDIDQYKKIFLED